MRKNEAKPRKSRIARKKAAQKPQLGREIWIAAARAALIAGGVASVKVEPLASQLGVTTGSFYWHFRNRDELLEAVLDDWETTNSAALFKAAAGGGDAMAQLDAIADIWINETQYCPDYDSAVRDWARISAAVEERVRAVDGRRIALLKGVFLKLGLPDREAFVRARITYFHQVGYYAMRITESRSERNTLKNLYIAALTGGATRNRKRRDRK